jgi:hypothetical protein
MCSSHVAYDKPSYLLDGFSSIYWSSPLIIYRTILLAVLTLDKPPALSGPESFYSRVIVTSRPSLRPLQLPIIFSKFQSPQWRYLPSSIRLFRKCITFHVIAYPNSRLQFGYVMHGLEAAGCGHVTY